jgi:solute carrier family 45 protein 1/2/4
MEKLHEYQGVSGRLHEIRDDLRLKISNWRESHDGDNIVDLTKNYVRKISTSGRRGSDKDNDYSHIYRSVT